MRTLPGPPYLLVLGLSFRTNVRNLRMIVEISPFGRNDRKSWPDSYQYQCDNVLEAKDWL